MQGPQEVPTEGFHNSNRLTTPSPPVLSPTTTSTSTKPTFLLNLPFELSLQIYSLILVSPEPHNLILPHTKCLYAIHETFPTAHIIIRSPINSPKNPSSGTSPHRNESLSFSPTFKTSPKPSIYYTNKPSSSSNTPSSPQFSSASHPTNTTPSSPSALK